MAIPIQFHLLRLLNFKQLDFVRSRHFMHIYSIYKQQKTPFMQIIQLWHRDNIQHQKTRSKHYRLNHLNEITSKKYADVYRTFMLLLNGKKVAHKIRKKKMERNSLKTCM